MTTLKKKALISLLFAALLLGYAGASSLSSLENLVGKWIELRAEFGNEQRAWKEQKQQVENEIALLERERKALDERLGDMDLLLAPIEKERGDLAAERRRLQAVLDGLVTPLERAEEDLRTWRIRIPASIGGALDQAFSRLPENAEAAAKRPVTRRVQLVIALYTEIERLQHGFHSAKQRLDVGPDRKMEVDVLYLGLSRGYAVSRSGEWAAVGKPGPDGWSWTPEPGIAASVRKALRILNNEEIAEVVDLPLVLSPGTPLPASPAEGGGQ